jgi:hypothetical protein
MPHRVRAQDDRRQVVEHGLEDRLTDVRDHAPIRVAPGEQAIHPAVSRALEALERSKVHWCLLRGESDLASLEGDVDLLVAPSDMPRLRDALAPLGYVPLRAWGRGPHRFFVAYDEASARRVKLDVVTQLAYGRHQELRTAAAPGCLARRRYVGGLALLSPGDAFWALLLHCMLDREAFSAAHRGRLLELAGEADCDIELANIADAAFAEGWGAATVLELVRAEDWTALTTIAKERRGTWANGRRLEMRLRVLVNRALRRASNVLPLGRR